MLNPRLEKLKDKLASKYPIEKIITSCRPNSNSPVAGIRMKDSVVVDLNDVPKGFVLAYFVISDMGCYFDYKPPLGENYYKFFAAIFESADNGNKED